MRRIESQLERGDLSGLYASLHELADLELNQPLAAIAAYSDGALLRIEADAASSNNLVTAIERISADAHRAGGGSDRAASERLFGHSFRALAGHSRVGAA